MLVAEPQLASAHRTSLILLLVEHFLQKVVVFVMVSVFVGLSLLLDSHIRAERTSLVNRVDIVHPRVDFGTERGLFSVIFTVLNLNLWFQSLLRYALCASDLIQWFVLLLLILLVSLPPKFHLGTTLQTAQALASRRQVIVVGGLEVDEALSVFADSRVEAELVLLIFVAFILVAET